VGPVQQISEDFFKCNENGESPFYFALKNRRWGLLKLFSSIPTLDFDEKLPSYIRTSLHKGNYRNTGKKVIELLMNKSRCDDADFFKEFFEAGMEKFFTSGLYQEQTRKSGFLASFTGNIFSRVTPNY
jgi:hypothetical protein